MTGQSSTSATPITQIRAELEAATPGPWQWDVAKGRSRYEDNDGRWVRHITAGSDDNTVAIMESDWLTVDGDARLIAHAPTYLAALLDVAEAAQRHRESWATTDQQAITLTRVDLHRALDQLLPQKSSNEASCD